MADDYCDAQMRWGFDLNVAGNARINQGLSETPMMFMKTLMTALITSLFMNDDDVGMATEETTVLRVTDTPDTFCGTAVWWGRLGLCYQGHQHQDQPLQRKHSPSKQWIC